MKFEGIYPPIITPFRDDMSVDDGAFAEMIEFMIDKGVHGIIVAGTTGEYYALSQDERLALYRRAHDVINGRLPWFAGVGDISTDGSAAYGAAAREIGADAILVNAPYYSLPTERELVSHCFAVDRAARLPVMLYNYPGRTGVNMGEEFLERVSRSANFQAIKEASGDINRIHLLAREFPHIQLSCGADDQTLEFFAWGATSWVTALGNFFPEESIALYEACVVDGDYTTGRKLMSALLPLTTVLERGGKFLQCTKFACEFYGLPGGPPRKPLRPMKKELKRQMREVLETAKTTIQRILAERDGGEEKEVPYVRLADERRIRGHSG